MELSTDLKRAICALFEVHDDERGIQRIITPLEYPGSQDKVVVRVRPTEGKWKIDENGDAALYARMNGGNIDGDNVQRWASGLEQSSGVELDESETLFANVSNPRLLAPTLFHVASAAQQLYALATSHKEREAGDFKERVASIVAEVCSTLKVPVQHNARLPISGDLEADHLIGHEGAPPLIVITATSANRLLEAEVIHMQYSLTQTPGFVLAVAESQKSVGVKQFNRANYYTGKTVQFNPVDFGQLLRSQVMH